MYDNEELEALIEDNNWGVEVEIGGGVHVSLMPVKWHRHRDQL